MSLIWSMLSVLTFAARLTVFFCRRLALLQMFLLAAQPLIVGSVGILLCARHKIGLLLTCADDVREYCFMHLLSTPFFDTH
jgi:hypothetical protein